MKSLEELKSTPHLAIKEVAEDGGWGVIEYGKFSGRVIWSFGGGWEHVSVSAYKRTYVPSWEEMCHFKDMFWHDNEVVVQFHPAKDQYVNNVKNCLHLWRCVVQDMPVPPSAFVGIKDGQSMEDLADEIYKSLLE